MHNKKAMVMILLFIIAFIVLIPFASSSPDGLENAMEHFNLTENTIYQPPLSYGDSFTQGVISAAIGMALVSILTTLYIKGLRRF